MDKKMLFKQVALILLALIIVGVPGCVKNATVKINELHSQLEKGWNVILPDDTRLGIIQKRHYYISLFFIYE